MPLLTYIKITAALKLAGAAALFYYTRIHARRKKLVRWAVHGERP
jgi:hypothetical protein